MVLHGTLIGHVYRSANRRLVLRYEDAWRTRAGAFPLSLSMPLDEREHGHRATSAFLSGLLPDDPNVVEFWARLHGVSRYDAVKLLAHVGEDCAGAVQLVRPEDVDRVVGVWSAADTATFGDEIAIVLERYDRARSHGIVHRIHQEDMCQSLAIQPTRTYESDGGPGLTGVATLLARHSPDAMVDVARLFDANILNWLVAGPDAHAKNYSILHAEGPDHRLAPLYDVITALPYPRLAKGGARLAMAVGGERAVGNQRRSLAGRGPSRRIASWSRDRSHHGARCADTCGDRASHSTSGWQRGHARS